jgi:hypothetical protein
MVMMDNLSKLFCLAMWIAVLVVLLTSCEPFRPNM